MANKNPPVENWFKTDRQESCTAQISVRIPPSLKAKLKDVDNWQEIVRETLYKAVKNVPSSTNADDELVTDN